jgi:OFA family oxalate/formate antiporter-like MFS transporter
MAPEAAVPEERNIGWRVTFAAVGINLALGILYSWSVIKKALIADPWNWTKAESAWPYSIACLVFALVMVPAGRLQDKKSPRLAATIGGILVGLGLILASLTSSLLGFVIGFGLLAGAGIGFGYASATPPAVKWFPPARTGLIAGIVVSGFGLASVYISPVSDWLIRTEGVQKTVLIFGIAFLVVVCALAQLLRPPAKPIQFAKPPAPAGEPSAAAAAPVKKVDFSAGEMLKTWQFYLLWFMFFCGAGAGLMIIGNLAPIAASQMGIAGGFVLVAALAIGNGAGRIVAGSLSDKIGRKATLFLFFVLQAVLLIALSRIHKGDRLADLTMLSIISALIGANYGANLSLFPSITKDFYGLKNFGINYGLVFTAWGVGGFVLAQLASFISDRCDGSYEYSYYCAVGLLVVAAIAVFTLKVPHHEEKAA